MTTTEPQDPNERDENAGVGVFPDGSTVNDDRDGDQNTLPQNENTNRRETAGQPVESTGDSRE